MTCKLLIVLVHCSSGVSNIAFPSRQVQRVRKKRPEAVQGEGIDGMGKL
jgi:hypothetical protein